MAQHKREEIELEAPLLGDEYPSKEEQEEKGVGLTGGTLNLIKCVIGAGLLAIPRAFALLGAVAGSLGLAFVTFLTIVTIKYGLVYPSTSFGGPRQFLFLGTYSQTVRHWVGKRGEVVLTVMMVIGLLGFQASCLDILADILLGNDSNNGLLRTLISYFCKCHVSTPFDSDRLQAYQPTAACLNNPGLSHFYLSSSLDTSYDLGHHSHSLGPSVSSPELSPSLAWLMDRRIVLAQVLILFVLPLSLKRNMSSLSVINGVGLLALFAFLASVVSLAAIALKKGVAHRLPLWPNYKELGSEPLLRLMNGFGVLSVLLTAQACHGNIHPLMAIVKPYTKNRVNQIVTLTMIICFFFYAAVCVCAYLVFGNGIQEDILTNLSWRAMEPLIGRWPANIIANLLRVAYMISVMGTAVLNLFPLRQTVADLIMGPPPKPTSSIHTPRPDSESSSGGLTPVQSTNHFQHVVVLEVDASSLQQRVRSHAAWRAALHVPLTVALLGMAYILAVTVPSIWVMISLIGSVSITIMSFLMPAAVGWAALNQLGQISSFKQFKIRALLFIAAILGALMFVNGFVSLYLANNKSDGKDKKH